MRPCVKLMLSRLRCRFDLCRILKGGPRRWMHEIRRSIFISLMPENLTVALWDPPQKYYTLYDPKTKEGYGLVYAEVWSSEDLSPTKIQLRHHPYAGTKTSSTQSDQSCDTSGGIVLFEELDDIRDRKSEDWAEKPD